MKASQNQSECLSLCLSHLGRDLMRMLFVCVWVSGCLGVCVVWVSGCVWVRSRCLTAECLCVGVGAVGVVGVGMMGVWLLSCGGILLLHTQVVLLRFYS